MDRGRKISGKKKRKENNKWTVDGEKVKSKWTEERERRERRRIWNWLLSLVEKECFEGLMDTVGTNQLQRYRE